MRRSAAITLVLLGGGITGAAVDMSRRCQDPVTGQPITCPSGSQGSSSFGHGFSSWSHSSSSSGFGSSSGASTGQVSRGGFGGAGAAMHASS